MGDRAYALLVFTIAALGPLSLLAHVFFFGRTRWLRLHLGCCALLVMALAWFGYRLHSSDPNRADCREVQCALPPEE
jgi:uncharacterized membrane protein YqjE